jgi:hypothetical protein
MIVWGGKGIGQSELGAGARYNPAANTWTPVSIVSAPVARDSHTAVWTGTEMIIWGGWNGASVESSGARYNPTVDSWAALPLGGGSGSIGSFSSHRSILKSWQSGEQVVR